MLGQFLLLMLLATQEAMFEIHFARELYSLIMNYIFGDSLPPYMSWRGQWESNLPLWRPDEMSYGAMVTSCSTVAEKIIGLWRFTKRPASRRTRQWLVYIGIMKETLAKRSGEIDLHIVLQNYQFSHQKKETVLLLVDNESRYTPKVQRLEPENHDDGNSKFEIPPKIQDIRIWKSQGWTKQFFNFLGGTSFFFHIQIPRQNFSLVRGLRLFGDGQTQRLQVGSFQPGEVIFFGAGTWVTDDSGVPLFLRLDFWDKVGIFSGKNACLSFMRFFFVSHEKPWQLRSFHPQT